MFTSNFNLQIYPWQSRDQRSISVLLDLSYKHFNVVNLLELTLSTRVTLAEKRSMNMSGALGFDRLQLLPGILKQQN